MLRRPKPGDSEDDILRIQDEFSNKAHQPAVQIFRSQKNSGDTTKKKSLYREQLGSSKKIVEGGRFTIDLETVREDVSSLQVISSIQERNSGIFDGNSVDLFNLHKFENLSYSKEDGFPEVIDLSPYYRTEDRIQAPAGVSFFAAEFDRLHGNLQSSSKPVLDDAVDACENSRDAIDAENRRRLTSMNAAEVEKARREIEEKLDPKLIDFLKNRHKRNLPTKQTAATQPKVSRFKMEKMNPAMSALEKVTQPESAAADAIRQLEVLEDFADRKVEEKFNRLAADAVQLDFISKCARTVLPRQAQNATRLFENLKSRPRDAPQDDLLETARLKIDDIKKLYLEEVKTGERTVLQFAHGLNPVVDGCWMLRPIRTVLDAVQVSQRPVTADDIDILRLALLWSTLLFAERGSIFHTMIEPSDFYVRLAEIYMIGPEAFRDDAIERCIERLITGFLVPCASSGRLALRLASPVAGLDAFMPFYEELLTKFEEFSVGNKLFTQIVLLGAYGNSALGDGLECQIAVWSRRRYVVREATASTAELGAVIGLVRNTTLKFAQIFEEQYYVQYSTLLSEYASALRSRRVTRERNQGVFSIAADELGRFVRRHTSSEGNNLSTQKLKEFDALVGVVRASVEGVLQL